MKESSKKKTFNRLVLSFTVLSVVLIGSMGGYCYVQVNRIANTEKETATDATEAYGGVSLLPSGHSSHRWTYAMYRPADSMELFTEEIKKGLLTACGVIVVFSMVISYLLSRQLYVPIKNLMARVGNLQPLPSSGANEYMIIGEAFSFMKHKIVTLESQARKNDLVNLLLGISLNAEWKESPLLNASYCAAYIKLTEGDVEALKMEYERNRCLPGEFVVLKADEAAVIYCMERGQELVPSELVGDLQALQHIVGPEIGIKAAVGGFVRTLEALPESYRMARQASRYHFIYGNNTVISSALLQTFNANPLFFHFDHFRNALKAGDQRGVDEFTDHFQKTLLEGKVQIEAVELAVLQLIAHLYQCVIELEMQQILPSPSSVEALKKDTLHETMENVRKMSAQMIELMNAEGNRAHAEVIRTLKAYISEHLHEDLSLQILSQEVSLAPAYVSTLFSEATKSSFTEYVTKLRLDQAAELLIANSRLPVSAVAERVGYRNVQYFHSKFKARFGVTPVQYRKSQQGFKDFQTL